MSGDDSAKTRRGALWIYAGNLYLTLGQFALGVVLARLLGPADFGLFIAVTAYTSVLMMLAQFGLPQALLQAKTLSDAQANAAFWFATVLALAAISVAGLLGSLLAQFYVADAFFPLFLWMSSLLLLMPYTAVGLALLRRAMRFDEVARMEMLAFNISALLALVAALAGAGVYSLAVSGLAGMLTNAYSISKRLDWRPRRPRLTAVRPLLRYAGFVTANNTIGTSSSRADNMLIGAILGTAPLGLYNRAYSLARIPSDQFAESIGPLLLGSLARVQDDVEVSRARWFAAVCAIAALTFPFLVVLLVAGPAAVNLLYGAAWSGAGVPLQAMVIGVGFIVPALALRGLINAQGLVAELVAVNAWTLLATLIVVVALAPFGIIGIALGMSLREALTLSLLARVMRRSRLALRAGEVLHAMMPSLAASAVALVSGVLALVWLEGRPADISLLQLVAVGAAVFLTYGAAMAVIMHRWRSHAPLAAVRRLLADLLRSSAETMISRVTGRSA